LEGVVEEVIDYSLSAGIKPYNQQSCQSQTF
jgi:hypothetical protein